MDKNVQCVLIKNNQVLVAEVEEVLADIGSPDCRLINPYLLDTNGELIKWLEFTNQTDIMMRSDDVLTFVEPNSKLLGKYFELTS
jgi:hypothetical protein